VDNDKIKNLLKSAGLPKEVFSTTLVKQGMEELREYITGKVFEQRPVVYIYPEIHTKKDIESSRDKAELAFYLLLKELVLSGQQTFSCQLVDVHTALFKETDEAENISTRMGTQFLGVSRFVESGEKPGQFFTPYEIAYFNSWVYRRVNDEKGLVLLGDCSLSNCDKWWPTSMVAYLRKHAVTFGIKG
jgi:hypothetical protein